MSSSVVQRTYRPSINPALPGLKADETEYNISSYICGTVGGIGFGVAVSRVPALPGHAIAGGGKFVGITIQDIAQNQLPINGVDDAYTDVDKVPYRSNIGVMDVGTTWVRTDNPVAAGDAVYYDFNDGRLGNSANGASASGSVVFTQNPNAGETLTLNSTVTTFVDASPGAGEVLIRDTMSQTIEALVAFLNASQDAEVAKCTYKAYPVSPGGAAGYGADTLMISFDTPGVTGNAYTLATDVTGATVSGATLLGGYGGAAATGSIIWSEQPHVATKATGTIAFSEQPTADKKITLNGVDITFKASGATGDDVDLGIDLAATMLALKTKLNASVNAEVSKCTYDISGDPADTLTIEFDTAGTGGNAYTIASDDPAATVSGGTLEDGTADSKIVLNGVNVFFRASGATGDNVDLGEDLAATMAALKTKLNASVNAQISKCTYDTTEDDDGITIVSDTVGTTNNAFTVTSDDPNATVSGATLEGGIVPSVLISNAMWVTSALAGELAQVCIGMSR